MRTAPEHTGRGKGATPELFILEDEQSKIVYAPLAYAMARVNDDAAALVERVAYEAEARSHLTAEESAVIETLESHGFFDVHPFPHDHGPFRPIQVTLFPTNRCNLRCSYCYAEGGEAGEPLATLDRAAGRAAIDLVSANAVAIAKETGGEGCHNFLVSFHGNGEPFAAFDTLRELCFYAQQRSEDLGFPVVLNVATNGVLTEEQLDFLIAYFDNVNISFDGLPDIQDAQRPLASGAGSFAEVDRTLRRLDESGKEYGIRATLTAKNVSRIGEMADFVAQRYPHCAQLHLEPVWECGRCLTTHEETPPLDEFVRRYLEAIKRVGDGGLRLVYSGARQDIVNDAFCSVSHGSFTVVPTGDVTACFEVSYKSDPRSERYFFGAFDAPSGAFHFEQDKLDALSRLNVHNMPFCEDCFCRWHCAGDCAAKLLEAREPESNAGSDRCTINRALTLDQIQRRLAYTEENTHG